MLHRNTLTGALVLALASTACSQDWDFLDPRVPGGSSAGEGGTSDGAAGGAGATGGTSLGGSGATGGFGATGGMGATGAGGTGAVGGTGGTGGVLSDDGLVVRYYLDEASNGTAPLEAADAAPGPLPLPIEYVGQMEYVNDQGQRGMHWPTAGQDGAPHAVIGGTKVMTLAASNTGTIEAVARIEEAHVYGSRLVHIGEASDWSFSLGVSLPQPDPAIFVGDPTRFVAAGTTLIADYDVRFAYGFDPAERFVVHQVFDTNENADVDRVRLYVNGTRITANGGGVYPALGDGLMLLGTESIGMGNRAIGGRSTLGTLYYGAYYSTALTEATIGEHVDVLLANDDTP